jgi:Domain of Unknown Function (DUF928)
MTVPKTNPFKLACLSLGLLLELLLSGVLTPAFAQSIDSFNSKSSLASSFKPPEGDAPEHTVGGGSRPSSLGLCPQDQKAIVKPLTALLSAKEQAVTIAERPTFFVYLPETGAERVSLTIADATESYYFETTVPIAQKSGVVGINLPEDAPPLMAEENYTWSVTILCGKTKRPDDPYVSGTVRRIDADTQLTERLAAVSWQEKASLYEASGIWYDALNAVAIWKEKQPNDPLAAASWAKMLASVGLEPMSAEALVTSLNSAP